MNVYFATQAEIEQQAGKERRKIQSRCKKKKNVRKQQT